MRVEILATDPYWAATHFWSLIFENFLIMLYIEYLCTLDFSWLNSEGVREKASSMFNVRLEELIHLIAF